ncbi:MAG: hypothetical protein V7672_10095 [Brevundimonas sp.]|uniref:hypothetical protein n=1 Tax=Brevundimonas sp. TaxID=1871086 RepID=UPI003003532D
MGEASAGARAWLSACQVAGIHTKADAISQLRDFLIKEGVGPNIERQLTDYISGITQRTSHPEHLSRFVRARGITCDDAAFCSDAISEDHIWRFEVEARRWNGLLSEYTGEFEVVRPSSVDIESGKHPEWDHGVDPYTLSIEERAGRFNFSHRHRDHDDCWIGNALTNGRQIFLIGFDYNSPDIDVSLCILVPHKNRRYSKDILVGVQKCVLPEDKVIFRRISFVRAKPVSQDADIAQLRSAGKNWVLGSEPAERGMILKLAASAEPPPRD